MQLYPLRLIPKSINFSFIKFQKITYIVSIVLTILSILIISVNKFNFGIDFTGGILLEIHLNKKEDFSKIKHALKKLKLGEVVLQTFGKDNELSIKIAQEKESQLVENMELIKNTLDTILTYKVEYRKIDLVGPTIGKHLVKSGFTALILGFIGIILYTWLRFQWYFGLGIFIALMHDIIVTLGFASLFQIDFNLSTIAAILTIIGYSVNDSVVIYDRIRENLAKKRFASIKIVINNSIIETLSRTIITVITTVIANLALVIFGGEEIYSFSILVLFGILIGTYSSIFISAPILSTFFPDQKV